MKPKPTWNIKKPNQTNEAGAEAGNANPKIKVKVDKNKQTFTNPTSRRSGNRSSQGG